MLIAWLIVTSSFGRVLTAIREDERAIEVFGYQATHYKLAIWVISAMMAGLAGGLFSSWTSFIDPNSFILLESVLLVSIVILGGLATIWGFPPRGDDLRAARRGNAILAIPAHRSSSAKPGKSYWASSSCCSCSSGRRAWLGGTGCERARKEPRRAHCPGDARNLQALRRGQGCGPAFHGHKPKGHNQHCRTQRLGEINPREPAQRRTPSRWRLGRHRRRWPQGRQGPTRTPGMASPAPFKRSDSSIRSASGTTSWSS